MHWHSLVVMPRQLRIEDPGAISHTMYRGDRREPIFEDAPDRQLDHILTDDRGLRGSAVEAEPMGISDHRPLVVDLAHA